MNKIRFYVSCLLMSAVALTASVHAVDMDLVNRYLNAANDQYSAGNYVKAFTYINTVLYSARPKLAYLDSATVEDGSIDEAYTGKWEITLVPTANKAPQDTVNVGLWKTSAGVITTSAATANSNGTNWGRTYGNGTANPVLGYAIRESSTKGYIETAQKR